MYSEIPFFKLHNNSNLRLLLLDLLHCGPTAVISFSSLQSATKLLTHSPFLPPTVCISSLWFLSSPLACPFSPPSPQTMLCRNCCDLEEQTSNIEWVSGVFSTVYCVRKWMVLFGAVKVHVLWKDNVAIKYVADCRCYSVRG